MKFSFVSQEKKSMRNIWLVAQQEFTTSIRTKTYLWTAFGLPILMLVVYALIFAVALNTGEVEFEAGDIGYVDNAGIIEQSNNIPDILRAYDSPDTAEAALENEEILTYIVIPEDYMQTGRIEAFAFGNPPRNLDNELEEVLLAGLSTDIETDLSIERLSDPVNQTIFLENNQRELSEGGIIGLFVAPLMLGMLIFFALQISSSFLMMGVAEEKSNHIMEILITSIRPSELLAGKILGAGGLGLLQLAVWGTIAVAGLSLAGNRFEALSAISIPLDLILLSFVYFLLAYFLFGSALAGLGAVLGSEQEARQYAGFVGLLLVIPVFFITRILSSPDSNLVIALTLIPITSPVTVIFRSAISTVPAWQLIASISIMLVSTLLITWLSAKIFRWAILLYGKSITPKTLWYVITGSPDAGTLPPDEADQAAREEQIA
jgi:ABC-2 type transport system permease protein